MELMENERTLECHWDSEETEHGDHKERESDGEPLLENNAREETMLHMDIQERNTSFISLGRVLSEIKK